MYVKDTLYLGIFYIMYMQTMNSEASNNVNTAVQLNIY